MYTYGIQYRQVKLYDSHAIGKTICLDSFRQESVRLAPGIRVENTCKSFHSMYTYGIQYRQVKLYDSHAIGKTICLDRFRQESVRLVPGIRVENTCNVKL